MPFDEAFWHRKILHVDMDAFYASVEQRDFPELRGKAIAVGGGGARGVVATASYEARKFGVHSAMPGFLARQRCPQLIFVPPRFDVYKEASLQVRAVFKEYTDLIEPLSLDEAFLDVTENKQGIPFATDLAKKLVREVYEATQLTCSAGVSYCKFLAKVASDFKKPNGITVIKPSGAAGFLEALPIGKFHGIGKVTAKKMNGLGIHTGADLKKWTKIELAQRFGKSGIYYFNIVRGIDRRPIVTERTRKSVGAERTLRENKTGYEALLPELQKLMQHFFTRLERVNNYGRTLTLKLKTADFQISTRACSKDYFIKNKEEMEAIATQLLLENTDELTEIRLIGLSMSNLQHTQKLGWGEQLEFDFDWEI